MSPISTNRHHTFWIFTAYLLFVVYGSLLPFEYREYTLAQAIEQFAGIGYLDLGVVSRADWMANIVLYIPLAYLCCAWILGMRAVSTGRYLALLLVFAICLGVAVAVEFTQIFFAPRTVSLNDLLAETLGTLGGIGLWAFGRGRIMQLRDAFAVGGHQSVVAAIAAYGMVYVALSLFPYDFLISARELAWKLESGSQGWLISGGCSDWVRCVARLAGDMIAIAPLGVLIRLAFPHLSLRRIFSAGLALGLALEGLQFMLASGTSQGLSVVLRGIGLVGGAMIGELLKRMGPAPVARFIWRATPFIALPYLLLLAAVAGWFSGPWLSPGEALARLTELRVMPFYYHYFSTEPAAMASLLANAAMYAPIGGLLWARQASGVWVTSRGSKTAALWAVALALPIELGKLLVASKHPDFTNLLIAACAAAFTYALASWIEHALTGRTTNKPVQPITPVTPKPAVPTIDWPAPHPAGLILGIPAALAILAGLASYPTGVPLLAVLLLGYGMLLWRWPLLWFFLVPALLPVLDLSPLTGRLLLDEFDLLVLVTLAVGYLRVFRVKPLPWPNRLLPVAITLLWITWVVATTKGLWPLLESTGGLLANSHSPLEAWHVGKGLLWALLLVPLIRRVPADATQAALGYVLNGLMTGLAIVTLAVIWERHVYVGVLDFENVFRVTGTFASMHTGGAYIEAFIAFAFPALVAWVLLQRSWPLRVLGMVAAALVSYAMLVTFSRGGYAGLVAGLLVVALGTLRLRSGASRHRWMATAGLVVAVIAVAVPVLSGGFAKDRLARAADDFSFRLAHWGRALDIMEDGLTGALTGMGFGQYPTQYLLNADYRKPPGTYGVRLDNGNPYLSLGTGETVFLDQLVDVEPERQYQLSARVQQQHGEKSLGVSLCEKALLYSFNCTWHQFEPEEADSQWSTLAIPIDSGKLGSGGSWPHRPVKLSLYNPGSDIIDVDDVSLKTGDGRELLENGSFSDGIKHWLFVTDQDIAWHIHQQWVEMYFAQGLLGLMAFVVLLLAVTAVLWQAVLRGNLQATAFGAALVAFLTVGLLGSTMDTARLSMLFYLGAFVAGLSNPRLEQMINSANRS